MSGLKERGSRVQAARSKEQGPGSRGKDCTQTGGSVTAGGQFCIGGREWGQDCNSATGGGNIKVSIGAEPRGGVIGSRLPRR